MTSQDVDKQMQIIKRATVEVISEKGLKAAPEIHFIIESDHISNLGYIVIGAYLLMIHSGSTDFL